MCDYSETYSMDVEDINYSNNEINEYSNEQELPDISDFQDIDVSWESIDFGGDEQPDGLF